MAKFDEFKYAAWELYNGCDIIQYLCLYRQYPQTEYLLKLGLGAYVHSKQLLVKIGKDKHFQKWLGKNRTELAKGIWYVSAILQAYKKNKSLKEVQAIQEAKKKLNSSGYNNIRALVKGETDKFLCYIGEQNTNISSYADYLKACNYLGLDMSLPKNRYPHDFKRWHDIRIDEYRTAQAIADEKAKQEMYLQFAAIAEKYLALQNYTKGAYAIVIANSPADIVKEGEVLNHCVGRMNYDQRVLREESLIFFIRNKDNVDTPFVTVEYRL